MWLRGNVGGIENWEANTCFAMTKITPDMHMHDGHMHMHIHVRRLSSPKCRLRDRGRALLLSFWRGRRLTVVCRPGISLMATRMFRFLSSGVTKGQNE